MTEQKTNADPKDISEDVVAVYNEHVAVISEHKKSQFQITAYLMALFAGILTLRHEIVDALPEGAQSIIAILVPVLLGSGGIYTIWNVQESLDRRRELIALSRKFLTVRAQSVYGADEKTTLKRSHNHIPIFCSSLTFATAAICILILMNES